MRPRLKHLVWKEFQFPKLRKEMIRKNAKSGVMLIGSKCTLESIALMGRNEPGISNFHITVGQMETPHMMPYSSMAQPWIPPLLDQFIIRVQEGGIFQQLAHENLRPVRRFVSEGSDVEARQPREAEYEQLVFRYIITVLVLWGIGLFIASLVKMGEMIQRGHSSASKGINRFNPMRPEQPGSIVPGGVQKPTKVPLPIGKSPIDLMPSISMSAHANLDTEKDCF